jgi:hypothetical protein
MAGLQQAKKRKCSRQQQAGTPPLRILDACFVT